MSSETEDIKIGLDAATPRPWKLGGIGIVDWSKGCHVVDMGQPPNAPFAVCYGDDQEINNANAELIVRAVNRDHAFEAMKEALKKAEIGLVNGIPLPGYNMTTLHDVRAALALAEKEE